jgi:hypothetical protein
MAWRLYRKEDQAAVELLHEAMIKRVGEKFELPALDERPVLISLVHEKAGAITHAIFLEAQAELCAMGDSALGKEDWKDAALQLAELCKVYDLHFVRAFVPTVAVEPPHRKPDAKRRRAPIERLLHHFGFVREDLSRITPFTRRMA